jgi:hypothetical protein
MPKVVVGELLGEALEGAVVEEEAPLRPVAEVVVEEAPAVEEEAPLHLAVVEVVPLHLLAVEEAPLRLLAVGVEALA